MSSRSRMSTGRLLGVAAVALAASVSAGPRSQDHAARVRELEREVAALAEERAAAYAAWPALTVGGESVDPRAVMRQVLYQHAPLAVHDGVTDMLVLQEMARQLAAGTRQPAEFAIADDELGRYAREDPGADREALRRSALFDRVFLDGPPSRWPARTRAALAAGVGAGDAEDSQARRFFDMLEDAAPPIPEFWRRVLRQWVGIGLLRQSDVRFASDDLSADAVVSVDGVRWSTAAAFAAVRSEIDVHELERAQRDVVLQTALRQALRRAGVWVDPATARARRQAWESAHWYDMCVNGLDQPIFRLRRQYPGPEVYRAWFRLYTSFADLPAARYTEAELRDHAARFAAALAGGRVELELLAFPARAGERGAWLPGGIAAAAARCAARFAELERGELTFDAALAELPAFDEQAPAQGRLGPSTYEELEDLLHETQWTRRLDGYSLASFLFLDAEVGRIYGPLRGPDACYIARVTVRLPAPHPVWLDDRLTRQLAVDDLLERRFLRWVNGVVAATKIQ